MTNEDLNQFLILTPHSKFHNLNPFCHRSRSDSPPGICRDNPPPRNPSQREINISHLVQPGPTPTSSYLPSSNVQYISCQDLGRRRHFLLTSSIFILTTFNQYQGYLPWWGLSSGTFLAHRNAERDNHLNTLRLGFLKKCPHMLRSGRQLRELTYSLQQIT